MPPDSRRHEFFDHTADIGIRARGATLADVLIGLSRGLTELLAEDSALQPRQARPVSVRAADAEALTLAWLQELLFWFSTEHFLPVAYELDEVTPTSLRGRVRGETFDPARHIPGREVKAITRHLLEVRQQNGEWIGQVVVDI
jgi:SHS2 domain-containing protein